MSTHVRSSMYSFYLKIVLIVKISVQLWFKVDLFQTYTGMFDV